LATRLPAPVRREQLLDVALEEFGSTGYHETSMNTIALRAGVTKPVVYQHFPSKSDLYLEVLATVGLRLRTEIEGATASARSPQRIVEQGFGSYFRFFDEHPAAFRVLFGEASRTDRQFASEVAAVENAMAQWVSAILTIDYLDPGARLLFGHAIVGMAEGAVRHWFASGQPVSSEVLADQMAELAWIGLRGRR
jgi:AcrR family transcriptional regulator